MTERPVPSAPHAEQYVLGTAMFDRDVLPKVLGCLEPADFYLSKNRVIFCAFRKMHESGMSLDRVTVLEFLSRERQLDSAGGAGYLSELDAIPEIANLDTYIEIIQDKSLRRKTIAACSLLETEAFDETIPTPELVGKMTDLSKLLTQGERRGPRNLAEAVDNGKGVGWLIEGDSGRMIPTPWERVNLLIGGFTPGELVVIGGRPGMGKTALACQIADSCALGGRGATIFSMEMSEGQIVQRFVSARSSIPLGRLRRGGLDYEQRQAVYSTLQDLRDLGNKLTISERPRTVPAIRAAILQHRAIEQLRCVVVDYMQLLDPAGTRSRMGRHAELSEISRALKVMAMDFEVVMVVGSQLSREHKKSNQEPGLQDLRDSGAIESDADLVLFPVEDRELQSANENEPQRVHLVIAKNRNGPVGRAPLLFEKRYVRFVDV